MRDVEVRPVEVSQAKAATPLQSPPLQLNLQPQSALFHILWTASNSSVDNVEAAELFSIAKYIADCTDNLVDDLLSVTGQFLPRTFAILQKAFAKAQQENFFFPEFFTHI